MNGLNGASPLVRRDEIVILTTATTAKRQTVAHVVGAEYVDLKGAVTLQKDNDSLPIHGARMSETEPLLLFSFWKAR
jgi:hypothetical protein